MGSLAAELTGVTEAWSWAESDLFRTAAEGEDNGVEVLFLSAETMFFAVPTSWGEAAPNLSFEMGEAFGAG